MHLVVYKLILQQYLLVQYTSVQVNLLQLQSFFSPYKPLNSLYLQGCEGHPEKPENSLMRCYPHPYEVLSFSPIRILPARYMANQVVLAY